MIAMFFAHLLPHFDDTGIDRTIAYRIVSSLAAPLFLFLTGYNFSKNQRLSKVLEKSILFLIIASSIDVFIWDIIPCYSFDVLYCIAIGYFSLFFFQKLSDKVKILVLICIVIFSIFLQQKYSYHMLEPDLSEFRLASLNGLITNLFIDGWFPIFPWVLFIFLGAFSRSMVISINRKWMMVFSIIFFVFFLVLIILQKRFMPEMAVEVFYPADLVYLSFGVSFLILIWNLRRHLLTWKLTVISDLGKYSLFFYVIHLSILVVLDRPIRQFIEYFTNPHLALLCTYFLFLIFLFPILKIVLKLKTSLLYNKIKRYTLVHLFFH